MKSLSALEAYYTEHRALFEAVVDTDGFFNLGWTTRSRTCSFTDSQQAMVRLVLDALKTNGHPLLVDAGCGRGGPARFAADYLDARVIALDLLKPQLQIARHHPASAALSVTWLLADSQQLPLASGSADGVYSIESAFHYPDKAGFLIEAARVLKSGARLAVADIVMKEGYEGHWTHTGFKRALAAPHLWTVSTYRREAQACGLTPLHAYDLTRGVMRSLRLAGRRLLPQIPTLARRGHRLRDLLLVQAGFVHLLWTHPLIPATYRLLVFQKT